MIFNYFALLLGLPSFILIDHYRVKAKLVDFFCCFPASVIKLCYHSSSTIAIQNNDDTKAIETKEEVEDTKPSNCSSALDRLRRYKSPLTALVVGYYSPFLQNYVVKFVIVVVFTIWFGFCVWGCTLVEDGLNVEDIVPAGTVEHDFTSANVEHFASYSFRVVTKNINYADRDVQRALIRLSEETKTARYTVDAGGFTAYWVTLMTNYFTRLDQTYCNGLNLTLRTSSTFADMTQLVVAIYLSLNYSMPVAQTAVLCNPTMTGLPRLVEYDVNGSSFIPEDKFYQYIPIWVSTQIDNSLYVLYVFICFRSHWMTASLHCHHHHLTLGHLKEMCNFGGLLTIVLY